jgi:hypothetical protein
MYHKRRHTFLTERMTKEEKELLDMINQRLAEVNLHLRLKLVKIHLNGSISTEYTMPVHKWIKEDVRATSIVLEELTKYQSK